MGPENIFGEYDFKTWAEAPLMQLKGDPRRLESTPNGSVEQARLQLREYAERTKQAELKRALSKLEAHGELTAAQQETVMWMATRITDRILESPEAALNGTADPERCAKTILGLFEPDDWEQYSSEVDG